MDLITVAIVDNSPASRLYVEHELAASRQVRLVGQYASIEELDLDAPAPQVLLLDLMLGRDDTSSTPHVRRLTQWGAKVVLYTNVGAAVPLRAAVAQGASGVHLKLDLEPLEPTLVRAARGEFVCSSRLAQSLCEDPRLAAELSERQLEVLTRIADGRKQPSIAAELHITRDTVQSHLDDIRMKYLRIGRTPAPGAIALVNEARRDGYPLDPE
ncbi:LuxR C-terminal-related transcriptional regulator [Nocardioides ferulae]|uniref:LuxR C-terminal-related transcriptional regulator n=1 Tax=Nocardioides ferulae TaxID=2340821 RepID=UPI000EB0DE8E|nr:LuxR C-terminal-related transcriptional regulator [Nocardioides ferulae]